MNRTIEEITEEKVRALAQEPPLMSYVENLYELYENPDICDILYEDRNMFDSESESGIEELKLMYQCFMSEYPAYPAINDKCSLLDLSSVFRTKDQNDALLYEDGESDDESEYLSIDCFAIEDISSGIISEEIKKKDLIEEFANCIQNIDSAIKMTVKYKPLADFARLQTEKQKLYNTLADKINSAYDEDMDEKERNRLIEQCSRELPQTVYLY